MTKERQLYYIIYNRINREIELCDARPSALGGSFKRMDMFQIEDYLNYCKNTARFKNELRKEVGLFKYYFYYTFKFINCYNSHYYLR